LIRGNRPIKEKEIAVALGISTHRVRYIFGVVAFRKLRHMTNPHADESCKSSHFLGIPGKFSKGEDFLKQIRTGDETWVHHSDPANKKPYMEYRHKESPRPQNFKNRHCSKDHFDSFLGIQKVSLQTLLKKN